LKYAIFCNTPYQLFVASCFVYGNCSSIDSVDLYVDIDNVPQNLEIVERMVNDQVLLNISEELFSIKIKLISIYIKLEAICNHVGY